VAQFYQRIERCREIGGLTLADLALWLETPRETVKGWMLGRHYPTPALRTAVFQKLGDLE
jgi:DNA-binding transcriptional regulator YiaG